MVYKIQLDLRILLFHLWSLFMCNVYSFIQVFALLTSRYIFNFYLVSSKEVLLLSTELSKVFGHYFLLISWLQIWYDIAWWYKVCGTLCTHNVVIAKEVFESSELFFLLTMWISKIVHQYITISNLHVKLYFVW